MMRFLVLLPQLYGLYKYYPATTHMSPLRHAVLMMYVERYAWKISASWQRPIRKLIVKQHAAFKVLLIFHYTLQIQSVWHFTVTTFALIDSGSLWLVRTPSGVTVEPKEKLAGAFSWCGSSENEPRAGPHAPLGQKRRKCRFLTDNNLFQIDFLGTNDVLFPLHWFLQVDREQTPWVKRWWAQVSEWKFVVWLKDLSMTAHCWASHLQTMNFNCDKNDFLG